MPTPVPNPYLYQFDPFDQQRNMKFLVLISNNKISKSSKPFGSNIFMLNTANAKLSLYEQFYD